MPPAVTAVHFSSPSRSRSTRPSAATARCAGGGALLWFAPRAAVTLQVEPSALRTYTFNTHRLQHHFFCGVCGLATYSEGIGTDGEAMIAVNLRGVPALDLAALKMVFYDGTAA